MSFVREKRRVKDRVQDPAAISNCSQIIIRFHCRPPLCFVIIFGSQPNVILSFMLLWK